MMEVKKSSDVAIHDLLSTDKPNSSIVDNDIEKDIIERCKRSETSLHEINDHSELDADDVIDLSDMDMDDNISPEVEDALLAGDDLVENQDTICDQFEKSKETPTKSSENPEDLKKILSKLIEIDDDGNDSTSSLMKDDIVTNGAVAEDKKTSVPDVEQNGKLSEEEEIKLKTHPNESEDSEDKEVNNKETEIEHSAQTTLESSKEVTENKKEPVVIIENVEVLVEKKETEVVKSVADVSEVNQKPSETSILESLEDVSNSSNEEEEKEKEKEKDEDKDKNEEKEITENEENGKEINENVENETEKNENDVIENEAIENEVIKNDVIENEEMDNEEIDNEAIDNEEIDNEEIDNEEIDNEEIENEEIENEEIENEEIENEEIKNEEIENEIQNEENKTKGKEENETEVPKHIEEQSTPADITTISIDGEDQEESVIPVIESLDDDVEAGACAENDNNENLELNAKSAQINIENIPDDVEVTNIPSVEESVSLLNDSAPEECETKNDSETKELKSNKTEIGNNTSLDESVVCIEDLDHDDDSNKKDEANDSKKDEDNLSDKSDSIKLIQDEDEENMDQAQESTTTSTADEGSVKVSTKVSNANEIISDNSDNAQGDFANDKDDFVMPASRTPLEDAESNSSSSNLLQETKPISDPSECDAEDISEENEADEDEGDGEGEGEDDVELIEEDSQIEETADEEKEISPPAKRPRLSQESSSELSNTESLKEKEKKKSEEVSKEMKKISVEECEQKDTSEKIEASTTSSLKRPHEALETADASSEASETVSLFSTKKVKTDDSAKDSKGDEDKDKKETLLKEKEETVSAKEEEEEEKKPASNFKFKAEPSEIPIPLYPPPKSPSDPAIPLRLDFLKRFHKSFQKMTKDDLESLVMQKVVEAIIYKSEFAELRNLVEKQEKVITAHRAKITELSKQYRDLEMVHTRVVKDIQTRNSQFIMPVKITRAVGLQVYLTTKKNESSNTTAPPSLPPPPLAPATTTPPPTTPQRTQTVNAAVQSTPNTQRTPMHVSSSAQKLPTGNVTPLAGSTVSNTLPRRAGCVQKVTPQRPVPPAITMNSSPSLATPTRISNKVSSVVPTQLQRGRVTSQELLQQQQQQQQRYAAAQNQKHSIQQQQQHIQQQNHLQRANTTNGALRAQGIHNSMTSQNQQYRRSDSGLSNMQPTITTAKAKEKSFIDLTDEDDPNEQTSNSIATYNNSTARRSLLPQQQARVYASNNPANRNRPLPTRNNVSSSSAMVGGTSITKIPSTSSQSFPHRYKSMQHPAPLPKAPPHSYNPALKLPPPKPTIRISNMDNGIVISWSIDEPMENHAECTNYQIYAYQETSGAPSVDSWHHVGTVKAMLLPMAVTLTQFQEGQRYYFAVRAVDAHQRYGPFSDPKTWG